MSVQRKIVGKWDSGALGRGFRLIFPWELSKMDDQGGVMGDPARVLVVDDELNMCKVMETALRARGYEVTICTESARAMEQLQAKGLDNIDDVMHLQALCRDARGVLPDAMFYAAVGPGRGGLHDDVRRQREDRFPVLQGGGGIQSNRTRYATGQQS